MKRTAIFFFAALMSLAGARIWAAPSWAVTPAATAPRSKPAFRGAGTLDSLDQRIDRVQKSGRISAGHAAALRQDVQALRSKYQAQDAASPRLRKGSAKGQAFTPDQREQRLAQRKAGPKFMTAKQHQARLAQKAGGLRDDLKAEEARLRADIKSDHKQPKFAHAHPHSLPKRFQARG